MSNEPKQQAPLAQPTPPERDPEPKQAASSVPEMLTPSEIESLRLDKNELIDFALEEFRKNPL